MTPSERAQALASATGRPWWLWTDRHGALNCSPHLGDAAGWTQLQRFNPAGSFRQVPIHQSIASTK